MGEGLADVPEIWRSEAGEQRDRFPLMFGRQTRMALREHEIGNLPLSSVSRRVVVTRDGLISGYLG